MSTCIISCGKGKVWDKFPNQGPCRAQDVYTGSFFNKLKEYADSYYDDWYILSAKYGVIHKDFIIPESYDVTYNDPSTHPVDAVYVRETLPESILSYDMIEVVAGKKYCEILDAVFQNTPVQLRKPLLEYKGMGYQLQYLTRRINENPNTNTLESLFE